MTSNKIDARCTGIALGAALAFACGGNTAEVGDNDDGAVGSGGQSAAGSGGVSSSSGGSTAADGGNGEETGGAGSSGGTDPGAGGLGGEGGDNGKSGGQEGSGGSPEIEWGERVFCGEPSPETPQDEWCEGADEVRMTVSLRGASDGAEIIAGQDAVAAVEMINPREEHLNYPCVGLAFDHPGLAVTTRANPYYDAFALLQDIPLEYEMGFTVAGDVPSGTVVHGLLWFDSLNSRCENGAQVEFQFEVSSPSN